MRRAQQAIAMAVAAALALAACGGDDDGGSISGALADVPENCRDQMRNFLEEIEPLLEDVDWETATLADFESVGDEFEARANELEAEFEESGCDDIDLGGDDGFDTMIDYARDVAPGTVGFFEFLGDMMDSTAAAIDPTVTDESGTSFENCGDAIAYVERLMDEYGSLLEAPAADLLAFTELPAVIASCTPEQLEFLESPAVTDFLDG